jgi:hypothetical protein
MRMRSYIGPFTGSLSLCRCRDPQESIPFHSIPFHQKVSRALIEAAKGSAVLTPWIPSPPSDDDDDYDSKERGEG